jgi:hypothetical protein
LPVDRLCNGAQRTGCEGNPLRSLNVRFPPSTDLGARRTWAMETAQACAERGGPVSALRSGVRVATRREVSLAPGTEVRHGARSGGAPWVRNDPKQGMGALLAA